MGRLILFSIALLCACSEDEGASEPNTNQSPSGGEADETSVDQGTVPSADTGSSDIDADADGDSDGDSDGDVDSDADSDSGLDTGTHTEPADITPENDGGVDGDAGTDADADADADADEDDGIEVTSDGEVIRTCERDCLSFNKRPLMGLNVPDDVSSLFGDPDVFSEPGPCVVEPQLSDGDVPGALFPANGLRPRFRFIPPDDADLFELRISTPRQTNDLVVYTRKTSWKMPKEMWDGLATSSIDDLITVTIRSINSEDADSTPAGTRGTFGIAPVIANGQVVYFAATSAEVAPKSGWLAGFDIGDEDVVTALTLGDVGYRDILTADGRTVREAGYGTGAGEPRCIGCHAGTPDGKAVSFTDHWPWNVLVSSIEDPATASVSRGQAPDYLTQGAERLLNQPWMGIQTFSDAYWSEDTKILVASYGYPRTPDNYDSSVGFGWLVPEKDGLAWFDLMTDVNMEVIDYQGDDAIARNRLVAESVGEGFGLIELEGETLSASTPAWRHDGTTIAYTAATNTQDGRLGPDQVDVDIHLVPFNEGQGGPVEPLEGASEPNAAEYYPAYSPDDRLIAFNREDDFRTDKMLVLDTGVEAPYEYISIPGAGAIYYRPHAEVFIIESQGGEPIRLAANDPPRCVGQTSPGVINSWGRWSPAVNVSRSYGAERSYYWVIFSSARYYPDQFSIPVNAYSPPDARSSQLYMAAVVRDEVTGAYTTYPAIYLWNQAKADPDDPDVSNLTPAWGDFEIPSAIVE